MENRKGYYDDLVEWCRSGCRSTKMNVDGIQSVCCEKHGMMIGFPGSCDGCPYNYDKCIKPPRTEIIHTGGLR